MPATNDRTLPPQANPKATGAGGKPAGDASPPDGLSIETAVERMFEWLDTDGEGGITIDEITALLHPNAPHGKGLTGVVKHIVGFIDGNEDGVLDTDEVTAAITQLDSNEDGHLSPADLGPATAAQGLAPMLALLLQGGPLPGAGSRPVEPPIDVAPPVVPLPPIVVPPPGKPVVPSPIEPVVPLPTLPERPRAPTVAEVAGVLLLRFDADEDRALNLSEILAVLDPRGQRSKLATAIESLIGLVDTGGDGVMSETEIAAAVATLDTDGSGVLDHRDHVPGPPDVAEIDLIGLLLPRLREFDITSLGQFG